MRGILPARCMDTDSSKVSDRVFILAWRGNDLARLRSEGGSEMFWERFRVEPLVAGALLEKLFDPELWNKADFALRHERTGSVLESVFSAGGQPPSPVEPDGRLLISIRGTYMFTPPSSTPSALRRLGTKLRKLLPLP